MTLLVVYITIAIGVSFVCSVMEAVILSVSPAFIGALEEKNPESAGRLKALKAQIDRPLAAILSLNTVAHTVGAAGAGAQAAVVFGSAAVGVFSGVLTLGILVLSEIIPKTVGAVYWRSLAGPVARLLQPLIVLLYPLVLLSQWLTRLIARGHSEHDVSRDEFVAMADIGFAQGVFEEHEIRRLKNLLQFDTLTAKDVMTPRTVMVSFPETATAETLRDAKVQFSRIPVYEGNRDHVTGFVLKDDVLEAVARDHHNQPLSELKREILTVSTDLPLSRVFDRLIARREHLALVVDEYGGTAGLVSVEDIVETLLGMEILDEADRTSDMQALAKQRWAERARRLGHEPNDDGES